MCSSFIIVLGFFFKVIYLLYHFNRSAEGYRRTRKEIVPFQEILGLLFSPVFNHIVRVGN